MLCNMMLNLVWLHFDVVVRCLCLHRSGTFVRKNEYCQYSYSSFILAPKMANSAKFVVRAVGLNDLSCRYMDYSPNPVFL